MIGTWRWAFTSPSTLVEATTTMTRYGVQCFNFFFFWVFAGCYLGKKLIFFLGGFSGVGLICVGFYVDGFFFLVGIYGLLSCLLWL